MPPNYRLQPGTANGLDHPSHHITSPTNRPSKVGESPPFGKGTGCRLKYQARASRGQCCSELLKLTHGDVLRMFFFLSPPSPFSSSLPSAKCQPQEELAIAKALGRRRELGMQKVSGSLRQGITLLSFTLPITPGINLQLPGKPAGALIRGGEGAGESSFHPSR